MFCRTTSLACPNLEPSGSLGSVNPDLEASTDGVGLGVGSGSGTQAWFTTTHWSVVRAAGAESAAALEQLCRVAWPPVYAFLRRGGRPPAEAQDLAQGFFAWFLELGLVASADPARGRFRSFLLGTLKHWLASEHERASALKRGGGATLLSLDELSDAERAHWEPVDTSTPAQSYDHAWALGIFERGLNRLRAEQAAAGKAAEFDRLKSCLLGEKSDSGQAALAVSLGVSAGALRVALHRLRVRFRALLRAEIAHTVSDPAAVEEELRHLADMLRS